VQAKRHKLKNRTGLKSWNQGKEMSAVKSYRGNNNSLGSKKKFARKPKSGTRFVGRKARLDQHALLARENSLALSRSIQRTKPFPDHQTKKSK
jgi:hypothetical protein